MDIDGADDTGTGAGGAASQQPMNSSTGGSPASDDDESSQSSPSTLVTYVFKTPRDRTALARVSRTAPYDEFVRILLEAAAKRDEYEVQHASKANAASAASATAAARYVASGTGPRVSGVGEGSNRRASSCPPPSSSSSNATNANADDDPDAFFSSSVLQRMSPGRVAVNNKRTSETLSSYSTTTSSTDDDDGDLFFGKLKGGEEEEDEHQGRSRSAAANLGLGLGVGVGGHKGRSVTPDFDIGLGTLLAMAEAQDAAKAKDANEAKADAAEARDTDVAEPTGASASSSKRRKTWTLADSSSSSDSSSSVSSASASASASDLSSTNNASRRSSLASSSHVPPPSATASASASATVTPILGPLKGPPPVPPTSATSSASATASASAYFVHGGKGFGREEYERMNSAAAVSGPGGCGVASPHAHTTGTGAAREVHLTLRLRLLGGTDRQNRVGSKFGGGGMASSANAERDRKERLRQLALESVDLAKDPYLMRNHLGSYECKLCLTLHTNEANYLAHTQGKKHQAGLAKRAAMEKKRAAFEGKGAAGPMPLTGSSGSAAAKEQARVRIGRPGYEVTKSRDPATNQRCLTFYLHYPEVDDPASVQPRHRFMSAYEQRVESPPGGRYQYLLVACDPYETVAFKVPAEPIDRGEGRFVTNWDREEKRFTLTFYYLNPKDDDKAGAMDVS